MLRNSFKISFYPGLVVIVTIFLVLIQVSCLREKEKKDVNEIDAYWADYDFKKKELISQPELIQQDILSFLKLLNNYTWSQSKHALELFMDKLLVSDTAVVKYAVDEVLEKYLFHADSPVRNEYYYLSVVDEILSNERISASHKERFTYQRKLITSNQVGSVANNFNYVTDKGSIGTLAGTEAEYLLLYFNNPDCEECKRMKYRMENTSEIMLALQKGRLVVLSVYVDADHTAWRKAKYPEEWINSYSQDQSILNNNLYDLRAIPSLYLLDKEKRVIIRDGVLEDIVAYFK
jgi:hypothetical protein